MNDVVIKDDVIEARNKLVARLLVVTNTGDGRLSKQDKHDFLAFIRETTAEVFGGRHEANEVLMHHSTHLPEQPSYIRKMMEDREFRRQFLFAWLDNS